MKMLRYKCHKEVNALEIAHIKYDEGGMPSNGSAVIFPANPDYKPFKVSSHYILRHKPVVGGYYVVYDDGYESFSPKEAFEAGYTLLTNDKRRAAEE